MKTYIKEFILPDLGGRSDYPYDILGPKQLRNLEFEPVTILYGSNGCGKSTLLNIIARKLQLDMKDRGNDSLSLEPIIEQCSFIVPMCGRPNPTDLIPDNSKFIRSEEVMHAIVDIRKQNERIKTHIRATRPDLYERFFNNESGHTGYVWSDDSWIYGAVSRFGDARSNGELAFEYFQSEIPFDSLILLDEPENSMSPKYQKELSKMILDYARFFNCQFIMATHSPFLLAIPDAKIYNLDHAPSDVCQFRDLETIKLYKELFDSIK